MGWGGFSIKRSTNCFASKKLFQLSIKCVYIHAYRKRLKNQSFLGLKMKGTDRRNMRKLEKRGSGLVENCKQEEVPKQTEGEKVHEEEKGKDLVLFGI